MKRILVIRGGAIGDFVLTLPALKLLRVGFPGTHLEILGYRHIVALAENRFYADAIRSLEDGRLARFFGRGNELPADWADYFASFDLVVSYLYDPDEIFQQNLRRCGVADFLGCSPKVTGPEQAALFLARPLEVLRLVPAERAAKLYPSEDDRNFARSHYESGAVALHPGSGSERKNWPLEHWLAFLTRLVELPCAAASLLVIGGEADEAQLTKLRSAFPNRVRFAQGLPLEKLAAVIEQSALFIGHDSGISHIAAATGTRSILLFGPTDPAVWAPGNLNARVIRSHTEAMRDISVEEVFAAAAAAIGPTTS